jgi:hypothetical protein
MATIDVRGRRKVQSKAAANRKSRYSSDIEVLCEGGGGV